MAKYYMKEDNLTSMSDSIRTISGKSNKLSTNDIISNLKDATNEVNDQVDLIEKIGRKFFDIDAVKFIDGTIRSYNNSDVTRIRYRAFANCNELVSVNCPNVIDIDGHAFYSCKKLESVDLPKVTSIDGDFDDCISLIYANLPKLETVGYTQGFAGCTSLRSITLPSLKYTYSTTFIYCKSLNFVDLGSITIIGDGTFYNCWDLETLIIRTNTVCALEDTDAFHNSWIEYPYDKGYIYVPRALIEDYKVATNWSVFSNKFRAIEDYPEICAQEVN